MLPKEVLDINGRSTRVYPIGTSADLDGSSASDASGVLDADHPTIVQITPYDCTAGHCRVAIAATPVADANSMLLPDLYVYHTVVPAGHKVAVLGGKANIVCIGYVVPA